MKLEYKVNEKIAPLAWIAEVTGACCRVTCGNAVETKESFFVEGAWDGSFSDGSFLNADWFCGTGGSISKNGVTFSTPSHVTSGIFSKIYRGGSIPL